MNVIFHQHIAVHLDTEKFSGLVDNPQEFLPVAIVPELSPASRCHGRLRGTRRQGILCEEV